MQKALTTATTYKHIRTTDKRALSIHGHGIETTAQAVITAITNNSGTSIYDQATAINDATTDGACTNAYSAPDPVTAGYSACSIAGLLKRVTDLLKIDFVTIVNVNLPGSVQSDND